jgi:hypothetical protein
MSWDDLTYAVSISRSDDYQSQIEHAMFQRPKAITQTRKSYLDKEIKIEQLLTLARTYDATDPKDKVYALLGLSPRFAKSVGVPDYSRGCKELWTSVCAALLQEFSLTPLVQMTAESNRKWRLDLSAPRDRHTENVLPTWAFDLLAPAVPWPMRAEVSDPGYVDCSAEGGVLRIRGTLDGAVDAVFETIEFSNHTPHFAAAFRKAAGNQTISLRLEQVSS